MKNIKKIAALVMTVLMLCTVLAACGGGSDSAANTNNSGMAFDKMESTGNIVMDDAMADGGMMTGQGITGVRENAKVIRRAEMNMETKDFDSAAQALAALVEDLEGYFESRNIYNHGSYRSGSFVVRVPVASFDSFCTQVGQLCNLTYFSANDEDVSEAYYDVEARLTTQRTKLERLQVLLSQAESMEDIITIESAISETELQIEYLTGNLRKYDSLIDYGTICINIDEVYRLSDEEQPVTTFGQRVGRALSNGWKNTVNTMEDIVVFLAYNWMGLIITAVIIGAVAGVVLRQRKRRKARQIELREKKVQEDKEN